MRTAPRLARLALVAGLLTACGGDDDTAADTTSTTSTTIASTATTAAPEPEATVLEVVVAGGQVEGGVRDEQVAVGDEITIRVTADVADEIHVHGYELLADTLPGESVDLTFVADIPGQFEVELHDAGLVLLNLVVA
jgi:hypothetical protein